MSITILTLMIIGVFTLTNSFPMHLIALGIMNALIMSIKLSMEMNIKWISYIIIIMYISGLMVIYLFIISMNSNNKFPNNNYQLIWFLMLIMSNFFILSNQGTSKFQFFIIFNWNWNIILMMTIIIIITLFFMSKLIFNPMKTSKSMS